MGEHQILIFGRHSVGAMRSIVLTLCALTGLAGGKPLMTYFLEFCAIGERVPGTAGHLKARDYIVSNLDNPEVDSFFTRGTSFFNIVKRFPADQPVIGIAAHWDSDINCPGANDGGSGIALLLKLADTLSRNRPAIPIDLIFFDGEDVGKAELIGSEHFAVKCLTNYSFVLVIDMVGDRDLTLYKEGNSYAAYPSLVDSIWRIGMEVAPEVFIPYVKYYIQDDHISLMKYGIRAINLIDFDYPFWDSPEDTPDKCSEESLTIMYEFLLKIVYPAED